MRIVIIGGGQTGAHLAEKFCEDEHDVVVIDSSAAALADLDAHLDLMTVAGDGANPATLEEADVERILAEGEGATAMTSRTAPAVLVQAVAKQNGGTVMLARETPTSLLVGAVLKGR